jgi:hypothetical protein
VSLGRLDGLELIGVMAAEAEYVRRGNVPLSSARRFSSKSHFSYGDSMAFLDVLGASG